MELSPDRKRSLRRRLEPLLAELDPELHLVELLVDSTKQHLAVIVQKDDLPVLLRLDWLRYVSMSEAELHKTLIAQLRAKKILPAD